MVKLTVDLIARMSSSTRKKREENLQQYLKKLTHLSFAEKNIDEIDDLSQCRNLSVLYLYDNSIAQIPNLGFAANLTHLYLQNNQIRQIERLSPLQKLAKLYLGGNCITVVEGFEKLEQLKELHLEHQRIPKGEKLLFDPRSLASLSICLQVLNVSGNNLDDITDLRLLQKLSQFLCSDNKLRDLKTLGSVLSCWPHLWRLELAGNPLSQKAKYRDRVIVMSGTLAVLDGKEINQTEKAFLMSWKEAREAKRKQREEVEQMRPELDGMAPPLPIAGSGRELPPVMPPKSSKSKQSGLKNIYIMPSMVGGKKRFEAVLAKSQSLPNSASKLKGDSTVPVRQIVAPGVLKKSHSDLERSARAMIHESRHFSYPDASGLDLANSKVHPSMNGNHIVPSSILL
ncbi:protein phosphatase 1 regulatory subunit 42-like [Acanthaster planci]|uniref:Protein phosphatase 1 regulatory subunit 42-like n=1 Tax=Acanthaster planci TaxID=133434 RepID=A0A8B7Y8B7_ACAPL|nr:protein phosphatase 1 regulatory subunit 42-like [Acanthaster planci]